MDYEGNWRDIFQNWEALAYSYPDFIQGMIFKFVNASTFDGYNPYRLTKNGFDWEISDPEDPWSFIGYWGDHQIIYLQKLLEILDKFHPTVLEGLYEKEWFVYANVPYKIKDYPEIQANPKDTIEFDFEQDKEIRISRDKHGADGALLRDQKGGICHVSFMEKILATTLSKLSNFVPEAGIWMNTQRPEWNDANNALVGNGTSIVTLCYLRRWMHFLAQSVDNTRTTGFHISEELHLLFSAIYSVLTNGLPLLTAKMGDRERKIMVDSLGKAGAHFRNTIYQDGFQGKKTHLSNAELKDFIQIVLKFIDHTLQHNVRADKLYHSYNLITFSGDALTIAYLDEMLEGQVAILSSGYLNAAQSLEVLDALRNSSLYRPDQESYILYPNKELPGFLKKNTISEQDIQTSKVLVKLASENNQSIIQQDINGKYHFKSSFRNAGYLKKALEQLKKTTDLPEHEEALILELYEKVFNHKAFTGRSGTFYGYEGLGSIYWHMVSKLLLATQETCQAAIDAKTEDGIVTKLIHHYDEIKAGIGVHKSPVVYGAFTTDPYSHTPAGRGAQQPGMTGQVKEDILSHLGETGVIVQGGTIHFQPEMLSADKYLKAEQFVTVTDLAGNFKNIHLEKGEILFTFCQVPVIYHQSDVVKTELTYADGSVKTVEGTALDQEVSKSLFSRKGDISHIKVYLNISSSARSKMYH